MIIILSSRNSPNQEMSRSRESCESSETINEQDNCGGCDGKTDLEPPLLLASLAGKQELVLKFTEMNQFGLPRAVDEVELWLGPLKLHVYPHQVHILTEIASAVTVTAPPKPAAKPSKQQRTLMLGLEGLIQENLKLGGAGPGQGLNVGWGEMGESREFMPAISRSQGFLTEERSGSGETESQQGPPMPRISVRLASCLGVLHMMDPGIIKLGGEPTRSLAMMSMRQSAQTFFSASQGSPVWESRKLSAWHQTLGKSIGCSHLQVLATPLSCVYEEGPSIGPGLSTNYAAITTAVLGKASVVEYLVDNTDNSAELVSLLKFSHSESSLAKKSPDVKLVYKDTYEQGELTPASTLSLSLNSCSLDLDPGFVDRLALMPCEV